MILCTFLGVTLNLILCVSLSYPQWLQSLEGVERWECVCVCVGGQGRDITLPLTQTVGYGRTTNTYFLVT